MSARYKKRVRPGACIIPPTAQAVYSQRNITDASTLMHRAFWQQRQNWKLFLAPLIKRKFVEKSLTVENCKLETRSDRQNSLSKTSNILSSSRL